MTVSRICKKSFLLLLLFLFCVLHWSSLEIIVLYISISSRKLLPAVLRMREGRTGFSFMGSEIENKIDSRQTEDRK